MKKTYKIEVDCANCANLMEAATKKVAGVATATVNFMTQKMTVEFVSRLRAEQRFDTREALIVQLEHDRQTTEDILLNDK